MFMTQPAISELEATQKKVHVTYSFPSGSGIDRTVTVLESPNVVAASGTTGTRTWNASLHLGTYLATMGNDWVCGKRILELGAGTGLISALCAKHLQAKYVLATDGNHEIVTALDDNMFLNQLVDPNLIQCRLLRWGTNIEEGEDGETMQIDTVLGADLVRRRSVDHQLLSEGALLLTVDRHLILARFPYWSQAFVLSLPQIVKLTSSLLWPFAETRHLRRSLLPVVSHDG